MRHHLFRPAAAAAGYRTLRALTVGAVAAALAVIGLPATAAQTTAEPAASLTTTQGATVTVVPLVTGDQVTVTSTPGGMTSYALHPAAGSRGAAVSYQTAVGEQYIIPAVALPYVGRGLDRSLFDVTALSRNGITVDSRLPISMTFAPGVIPSAPPGVTLTSVGGDTAQGYLTAGSGAAFAAALSRQIGTDVAAGHQAGTTPAFGGLFAITLAAAREQAKAQPRYPLHILQLDVTDLAGNPTNAMVGLQNNDDVTREFTLVAAVDGVARIEVPAGDYSANAGFVGFDAQGKVTTLHQVTVTDFVVPTTSGVTTTSIDERSATSAVAVTTPHPATEDLLDLRWYRVSATGVAGSVGLLSWSGPTVPVYVNAQPAATVGRLRYVIHWGGAAPTASSGDYRYDVAFGSDDVPATEEFVVHDDQVATVHEHFSADPASGSTTGALLNGVIDPVVAAFGYHRTASLSGVAMPGELTQYLGTSDGGQWAQAASTPNGTLFVVADPRTVAAGHDYSLSWTHGPLAAGFGRHTGPQTCQACVAGDTLSMAFNLVGDSEPDHEVATRGGFRYPPRDHLTLYRDGSQLFDADGQPGVVVQHIPTTPSTYRAVLDTDLTGTPGLSQSTRSHTDLTVPYTPTADPSAALPAGDSCAGQAPSTPCQILAALTLTYELATDQHNTSNTSVQELHLCVGHINYDGAGSNAEITSAAVSVSFDGGATWLPATVTGARGQYTAFWPNPASARGTSPQLRVTASDAIGGTIAQTVTSAYTLGATDPTGSSE